MVRIRVWQYWVTSHSNKGYGLSDVPLLREAAIYITLTWHYCQLLQEPASDSLLVQQQ